MVSERGKLQLLHYGKKGVIRVSIIHTGVKVADDMESRDPQEKRKGGDIKKCEQYERRIAEKMVW